MFRFQIYRRRTIRGRMWYWRLRSIRNGKVVATGGEGYHNIGDVESIISRIQLNAALADVEVDG